MEVLFIILIILAILFIIFLIATFVVYVMAFYNDKKGRDQTFEVLSGPQYDKYHKQMIQMISASNTVPYEDVYIEVSKNKKLHAKYYHVKDNAPISICVHGYKGHSIRDFSGGLTYNLSCGLNVLLIDNRAHGKSFGRTITFGTKERYDVLRWIEYCNKRFGEHTPIFLVGISMGAATVTMCAELKLPTNVKGIFADCPYTSPLDITLKTAKDMGFSSLFAKFILFHSALIYGHFRLDEASCVEAVKNTKIPIRLIHGIDDKMVPYQMSVEIRNANRKMVDLFSVPGAGHGMSFIVSYDTYDLAFSSFIKENINK